MKRLASFRKPRLTLLEGAWLGLPIVVWFSYWPNFHFGQDATMNFEVSLTLIYCAALALLSLPAIVQNWQTIARNRQVWLVSLLAVYAGLTGLWSANPTRGVLTAGIIGILYLIYLGMLSRAQQLQQILPRLVKVVTASAVIMSLLSIVQFFIGVWVSGGGTLLCAGCVSGQFGWPRPNVFAIEPQFFGSMLLPALFIISQQLLTKRPEMKVVAVLLLLQVSLLLTMSRGAIYAYVIGLIVLIGVNYRRLNQISQVVGLSLVSFVICLGAQGTAATLSPSVAETFPGAVAKSLNQLSLGLVDLRSQIELREPAPTDKELPVFDGYVEESTDIRLGRTEMALGAWRSDLGRIVFGVGLGGAGLAVHQAYPEQIGSREIVQNEYIERLLERGLVGLLLFVGSLTYLILYLRPRWLVAIVVGFMFQWLFFSGYPNAMHIYLSLALLAVVSSHHRSFSQVGKGQHETP